MKLAITGATGFVGGRLLDLALDAGHEVRALTRRPQPARNGVTWIAGALDTPEALIDLVSDADVVVHVAGVVNAPDRNGFARGNVDGTQRVVEAARRGDVARFIHVSSLAAREPRLSDYGWSKAEAERVVEASDRDWTIVRPTGVYGPGDTELRDMFRMAKLGLALLPPPGLVSLVHVDDLARLLLTLAERGGPGAILEVDDGKAMAHHDLARLIGAAVGRRLLPMALPAPLLRAGAWIDGRLRGSAAKLTPDRVGYLCHPDWTADPVKAPSPDLWRPRIDTAAGLAATAAWYRANGLL